MVNLVAAEKRLLHFLMKMAGVTPYMLEIQQGTTMNIWVPSETIQKLKKITRNTTGSSVSQADDCIKNTKPSKPVVVLVHGFACEGLFTWQFQVASLTKKYSVYVPDLIFFGGSITDNPDRSPLFQAECLIKGLRKLGVERCTVIGFSYGGTVAFKMAELNPDLVNSLVISGSIFPMTDSITTTALEGIGFSSFSELWLPTSVKGCKALHKVVTHKNFWFPDCLHKDFLEIMFSNRKERGELLESFMSNKDTNIPKLTQRIHLLWGGNDQIFKMDLAQNMKEQLGLNATCEVIPKAGHLCHLERPCIYNRCLKKFLGTLHCQEQNE